MKGLATWKGDLYPFRAGGGGGALDLRERAMRGANDLGSPDRRAWAEATRSYLAKNPDVNVVMWSWCGKAGTSSENIDIYLGLMEALIVEHPTVKFIFTTGHLDGRGLDGLLHEANEQIRAHCRSKGRTREVRDKKMKILETDPTVAAEKRSWERLERALGAPLRALENVARESAGSPSGERAAKLAREIRDLLESGGATPEE